MAKKRSKRASKTSVVRGKRRGRARAALERLSISGSVRSIRPARRELRSAAIIRALTDARPIKPISTRCLSARRPNPGRGSTYRRGNSVQRIGTIAFAFTHRAPIISAGGPKQRTDGLLAICLCQ